MLTVPKSPFNHSLLTKTGTEFRPRIAVQYSKFAQRTPAKTLPSGGVLGPVLIDFQLVDGCSLGLLESCSLPSFGRPAGRIGSLASLFHAEPPAETRVIEPWPDAFNHAVEWLTA